MGPVGRVTWAGLRARQWTSNVALVAVTAVTAMAVVSGLAVRDQSGPTIDREYRAAGRPDLVAYGSPDALARLAAQSTDVTATSGVLTYTNAQVVAGAHTVAARVMSLGDPRQPAVGRPLLERGRWVAPGGDEVVLDHAYAIAQGVHVGNKITLRITGGSRELTVVGTAIDLTDCFFPDCDPVRLFVDPQTFGRLAPSSGDRSAMTIARLARPAAADQVAARLVDQPGIDGTDTWPNTRGDITIRSSVFGAFLDGFGVFVLVAAALVVAAAMGARMVARRREIGLLKAVGYSGRQLTTAILLETQLLAAAGILIGWVAGSLLAPRLQVGLAEVVGAPSFAFSGRGLILVTFIIGGVLVLATIVPAWRASRESTAQIIRDSPSRSLRPGLVGHALERLGAPPTVSFGVADAVARPVRAALCAGALAIGVAGVIVAGGFIRSMQSAATDPAITGDPWDVTVERGNAAPVDVERRLDAMPEVSHWYSQIDRHSRIGDETVLARAIGGDPAGAQFVMRDGRPMKGANDAIAGYGFLRRFGVHVGDDVSLQFGDVPITVTIVGRYSETEDTGQVLLFRTEALAAARADTTPGSYLVSGPPSADRTALASSLREGLPNVASVQPLDPGTAGLNVFITAMLLVALIVLGVVLVNLLAALVTDARERARTLGVLRTVGFSTGQLVGQSAAGGAALGLVAGVLGLPLGLLAFNALSNAVTDGVGAGPGFAKPPSAALLVSVVPVVVALGGLAGALAARQLSRRPAAALVRYE
jgi:putative ABC transport system permease protein